VAIATSLNDYDYTYYESLCQALFCGDCGESKQTGLTMVTSYVTLFREFDDAHSLETNLATGEK